MSRIDTLVTDRTASDKDRLVAALERVNSGAGTAGDMELILNPDNKGAYNYTDFNRVGAALAYVSERLNAAGAFLLLSPKTDWAEGDEPTASQLAYYLQMLRAVRGELATFPNTPVAPDSMDNMTYNEANNIEQILVDIDELLTKMAAAYRHCGAAVCGIGGLIR